jgi:phytoene dehydrogenase-like protein
VFQWIGAYDRPLESLGIRDTLHFVCRTPEFRWELPGNRLFSEVLTYSAGDSYAFPQPGKPHFKVSCFSHADEWRHLNDEQYLAQKQQYRDELLAISAEYYPQLATVPATVEDTFTPLTVEHYTGHPGGTIYGGETKTWDGKTAVPNVFVIGNDQGGVGIVGALTSGVVVTNFNLLL